MVAVAVTVVTARQMRVDWINWVETEGPGTGVGTTSLDRLESELARLGERNVEPRKTPSWQCCSSSSWANQSTQQLLTAGCPQHRRQTKTVTGVVTGAVKGAVMGLGVTTGRTAMKTVIEGIILPLRLAEDDSDEPPARCPSMTCCSLPWFCLLLKGESTPACRCFAGAGTGAGARARARAGAGGGESPEISRLQMIRGLNAAPRSVKAAMDRTRGIVRKFRWTVCGRPCQAAARRRG